MKNLLLVPLLAIALGLFTPASAQVAQKKVIHHKRHYKRKPKAAAVITDTSDPYQKIYLVEFPARQSATNVEAFLLGKAYSVTFLVKITYGQRLKASLSEMSDDANININKVILPDGSEHGPFSSEMEYPLIKPGTYKVVVGCRDLNGDDWKGVFSLHVAIEQAPPAIPQ